MKTPRKSEAQVNNELVESTSPRDDAKIEVTSSRVQCGRTKENHRNCFELKLLNAVVRKRRFGWQVMNELYSTNKKVIKLQEKIMIFHSR